MPAEATRGLFDNLRALGAGLTETGKLEPDILKEIAKPERYPLILGPLLKLFLKTNIAHSYFDGMLHENNAYERRNDQPFKESA